MSATTHPAPGARPGELIAVGPKHRWLAYEINSQTVAACYVEGALLRRDLKGWWTADFHGKRNAVPDSIVALLVGKAPDGWPLHPEQRPLAGSARLSAVEA